MGNKQTKMLHGELSKSPHHHQPPKKSLPTAKDNILVNGYIRQSTDNVLESHHIFPLTITQWIYRYYQSKGILYWTSPQHIYSVSIEKDDTKERVNPLIKMDQCYCPAVTYKANINIPIEIPNKTILPDQKYNAIFKCGGIANDRSLLQECSATILKPPNIHKSEEELVTNLNLPLLPQRVASNCVVFSKRYGLLSIGGFIGTYNNWNSLPRRYISNVYRLEFNHQHKQFIDDHLDSKLAKNTDSIFFDDEEDEISTTSISGLNDNALNAHHHDDDTFNDNENAQNKNNILRYHFEPEWEWEDLSNMQQCRGYASAQIIHKKSYNNPERLIVIGGDLEIGNVYSKSCELYNFERNEWRYLAEMKHGRICSGIHYDSDIDVMYVGGGYCDSRIEMYSNFKKVEVYNCHKNVWYPFPDTNLKHAFYPYLWKHNNLLFIASAYSTGLEFIDLRIGMSWNAIYGEKNQKKKKFWHLFKKNNIHNATSGAICSGRLVG